MRAKDIGIDVKYLDPPDWIFSSLHYPDQFGFDVDLAPQTLGFTAGGPTDEKGWIYAYVDIESIVQELSPPYAGLPTPEEGDLYTSYTPLEQWDYTSGIWVPRDTSLNIPLTNLDYMFNAQTLGNAAGSTLSTWPNEGGADGAATGTGIMRAADLNGKPGVDFFQTTHSMVLPGTGTIPQPWSMFILFKEKNSIETGTRAYRRSGNTLWSPVGGTTWQFYVGDSGLNGPTDRSANRTYAMVVTANGGILNFYWTSAASGGTTYITSSVGAGGFGTDAFDLDTGFFNHDTAPSDGSYSLGLVGAWGLYSREVSGGEADIILAELMTKWDFTAA